MGNSGYGTLFEVTPSGALTTLYSFCSQVGCTDGYSSYGGLMQATDHNVYGSTYFGGANSGCFDGCGTLYRVTPSGGSARSTISAPNRGARMARAPSERWSSTPTGSCSEQLMGAGQTAMARSTNWLRVWDGSSKRGPTLGKWERPSRFLAACSAARPAFHSTILLRPSPWCPRTKSRPSFRTAQPPAKSVSRQSSDRTSIGDADLEATFALTARDTIADDREHLPTTQLSITCVLK